MTLVAGFRCRDGGVLLCADREEVDGGFKRSVNKIGEISGGRFKLFIAGAGPWAVISKAQFAIGNAVDAAVNGGIDVHAKHVDLIETALRVTYDKYVKSQDDEIGLIIVFAPVGPQPSRPLLYKTQGTMVVVDPLYASHGYGKPIADYLAERIYLEHEGRMPRSMLAAVAAFIFREAENAIQYVGQGTDMAFIFDGDQSIQYLFQDSTKRMKDALPKLGDAVLTFWQNNPCIPEDIGRLLDAPAPKPSTSHKSKDVG